MSEPIPTPRNDAVDAMHYGNVAARKRLSRALETECTRLRTALRKLANYVTCPIHGEIYECPACEAREILAELDSQQKQP